MQRNLTGVEVVIWLETDPLRTHNLLKFYRFYYEFVYLNTYLTTTIRLMMKLFDWIRKRKEIKRHIENARSKNNEFAKWRIEKIAFAKHPQRKLLYINGNIDRLYDPNPNEIIFLNDSESPRINSFIDKNYERICELFAKNKCHFTYLPKLLDSNNVETINFIKYNYPQYQNADIPTVKFNWEHSQSIITSNINLEKSGFTNEPQYLSSFIKWGTVQRKQGDLKIIEYYLYSGFQLIYYEDEDLIWEQINLYLKFTYGGERILFNIEKRKEPKDKKDSADYNFDLQTISILGEVKERIAKLRQIGLSDNILKNLLLPDAEIQLSKLVITKDYKIILTDYDMEIQITPLPKTVFLLYLKHPEGILFKHLIDYKAELMTIYKNISNRESMGNAKKSIGDIVNPTKNSINEKCSRIREAFVSQFNDIIAENYYIVGGRAEPKKILLDRNLVTWEVDI